ncbi:hypothetical protein SARC_14382, partial [Sphaeroforma arctica JP610]
TCEAERGTPREGEKETDTSSHIAHRQTRDRPIAHARHIIGTCGQEIECSGKRQK